MSEISSLGATLCSVPKSKFISQLWSGSACTSKLATVNTVSLPRDFQTKESMNGSNAGVFSESVTSTVAIVVASGPRIL